MESWKTIQCANNYEVSDVGNVRHKVKQKNRSFYYHFGYARIKLLGNEGKLLSLRVHRLVAEAFIKELEGGDVVDHIDRNRSNNELKNLRVTNIFENSKNKHTYGLAIIKRIIALHKKGMNAEEIEKII